MEPLARSVIAGSWALATEVCRRDPALRIVETHSGGGQNDCLTVVGPSSRIDINRLGSVHLEVLPNGPSIPPVPMGTWSQDAAEGRVGRLADYVCDAVALPKPHPRPPTTPRTLQYRVITRLLASRLLDRAAWDARSNYYDSSGPAGSWVVSPVPFAEMSLIPANETWRVLCDHGCIAWLWDGWVWPSGGERRDLMALYARGATIDELVGVLTAPGATRRAIELPEIPRLPDSPPGRFP